MTLSKGSQATLRRDELTTYSDKLNYPLARVPSGAIVTVLSGPNPYVYLTKGKGEMFYSVDWQGDRVAIASNNLKPIATKAGRSKTAKARKQLTADQLFFYEHAGYSYNPQTETAEQGRIRCAIGMARDEEQAANLIENSGWYFEWSADWDIDDSWMDDEEKAKDHTWEVCQLFDANDHVLASCGGIVDADQNYRRVMEAELAGEAIAELDEEIETLDAH